MSLRTSCRLATVVVLLAMSPGCTGLSWKLPQLSQKKPVREASPVRDKSADDAEAMRSFEARRTAARLSAVDELLRRGELEDAESTLSDIVKRSPANPVARRMLADVHLELGKTESAEIELRRLTASFPQDAEVHHSLGLLLDSTNRSAEARRHFQRAATLAPDNELYRMVMDDPAAAASPEIAPAAERAASSRPSGARVTSRSANRRPPTPRRSSTSADVVSGAARSTDVTSGNRELTSRRGRSISHLSASSSEAAARASDQPSAPVLVDLGSARKPSSVSRYVSDAAR